MRETGTEPVEILKYAYKLQQFGAGLICKDDLLVLPRQLIKHQILTSHL
jgi:hypothetical protein